MTHKDRLQRLQEKYKGNMGKLRQAVIFENAGIPEKFWFKKDVKVENLKNALRGSDVVVTATTNDREQIEGLSVLAMELCDDSIGVKMIDFYRLISLLKNEYGQVTLESLIRAFDNIEVVIISGIKSGDVLVKNDELFRSLIHNLIYDSESRCIVLGIDYIKGGSEKYFDAYGAIGEFIDQAENNEALFKGLKNDK